MSRNGDSASRSASFTERQPPARWQFNILSLLLATTIVGAFFGIWRAWGEGGYLVAVPVVFLPACLVGERLLGAAPVSQLARSLRWHVGASLELFACSLVPTNVACLWFLSDRVHWVTPFPFPLLLLKVVHAPTWVFVLVPAASYFFMTSYLARTADPRQIAARYPIALLGVTLLSLLWFVVAWPEAIVTYRPVYLAYAIGINAVFAVALWIIWWRLRRRANRRQALLFAMLLFVWLFWCAFPWLFQMP